MDASTYTAPVGQAPRASVQPPTPIAALPSAPPVIEAPSARSSSPQPVPKPTARPAKLSLATGAGRQVDDNISGVDPALLGRTYQDNVLVDGFKLPMPKGEWALLANTTVKANHDPNNKGSMYFLGRIENKSLVGIVIATSLRSPSTPGTGFASFQACDNPDNIFTMKEDNIAFGHQSCWVVHSFFTPPWLKWADKDTKLGNLYRAAAGDMAAKNITYPQDFVGVHFFRAETWGMLDALYLFSPENEHIRSSVALTFRDADWFGPNIHRFPEKVAYTNRLQKWGTSFWTDFEHAFDDGH